MPKVKYYAVKIGREGPRIYSSWDDCKANIEHIPGATHKSFTTRTQAEAWLNEPVRGTSVSSSAGDPANVDTSTSSYRHPAASHPPVLQTDAGPAVERPVLPDTRNDAQVDPDGACSEPDEVILSDEQQHILGLVERGQNVFFTGSAGTGKSILLREIIRTLKERKLYGKQELAITASTGIASVNIGGTTLHSWAGIGLGEEKAEKLAGKILGMKGDNTPKKRWRRIRTLIVDEISMIDGTLLDKLEYIARRVRFDPRPFGGIQLVLSGDFFQLPPVPGRCKGSNILAQFAFDSRAWKQCIGKPLMLTKVFRQHDQHFVNMLNAMRMGHIDEKMTNEFRQLRRTITYSDGIEPTELYPTRREVDKANRSRLLALPSEAHTYRALDLPGFDDDRERISRKAMETLLERLVATREVVLKVGAQVMLIKNLVQGELVNGTLGQVVEFFTPKQAESQRLEISQTEQPPDDSRNHNGQDNGKARIPSQVLAMGIDRAWPVVRFTNGRSLLCVPAEFTVNNSSGEPEASRCQIPLICAWALSVHKSQGQTLQRVRVDLGRTFEKGQAYVALSRATNLETLQVLNFHPSRVMAHPRVLEWYRRTLEGGHQREEDFDEDMLGEMDNEEALAAYFQNIPGDPHS